MFVYSYLILPFQIAFIYSFVYDFVYFVLFRELKLAELHTEQKKHNPANFGFENPRKCICVVDGQVPCPIMKELPKELRGKFKESLKDRSLKPELQELPTYPNFKKIREEQLRLQEIEGGDKQ